VDGLATAGLFGAVSASTLAAGMAILDESDIAYEGFIGALYPFMDIAALVTAIALAKVSAARQEMSDMNINADGTMMTGSPIPPELSSGDGDNGAMVRGILIDTFRSPAISALVAGLALGIFAQPDAVFKSFYEPLFRGLLSILMLIMGM